MSDASYVKSQQYIRQNIMGGTNTKITQEDLEEYEASMLCMLCIFHAGSIRSVFPVLYNAMEVCSECFLSSFI